MLTHPETIRRALERAHGGHWLPQELQAHRDTLRHGQASLQRQIERLTEAYLAGVMGLAEYQRRRRDLEQRQQALAGQERQLEAQADRQAEITRLGLNVERFCQRASQGLEQASWEQKRQLIEWLIARVVVTNGEVEIRYVIPTSATGETDRFCHLRSDHRVLLPAHETDRARGTADVPLGTATDRSARHAVCAGLAGATHRRDPHRPALGAHRPPAGNAEGSALCCRAADYCSAHKNWSRFGRSAEKAWDIST